MPCQAPSTKCHCTYSVPKMKSFNSINVAFLLFNTNAYVFFVACCCRMLMMLTDDFCHGWMTVLSSSYSVTTYSDATCSLNPSTTTTSLAACTYQYTYPPLYQRPYEYGIYYLTIECSSGLTAAPTGAPSGPSPSPTATPTVAATTVAQATGYVSQYVYDTTTCSGVPNSITAYSLGVCFYIGYYYVMYSATVHQLSITLSMGLYTNAACSVFSSSTPYTLVKACSSGTSFNYTTTSPATPLSIATRCRIQSSRVCVSSFCASLSLSCYTPMC